MPAAKPHDTTTTRRREGEVALPVRAVLGVTGAVGDTILRRLGRLTDVTSSALLVAWRLIWPSTWRPTVIDETIRQCYFTGVQAMRFVAIVGALIGLGFVTQILYWTSLAGQTDIVGVFLARVLIGVVAPLLTAIIVLGRSGTAALAEVGTMRVTGTVELIESSGVDPVIYLAVPRAVAMSLSVAGLAIWLSTVALVVGYTTTVLMGLTNLTAGQFADQVFGAMGPRAYIGVGLSTLLSGWLIGVICTSNGLRCTGSVVNVPQQLPRCFIEGLLATFIISGVITALI